MDSASSTSTSVCGDGWRVDDFFLFSPHGCLWQEAHFALMCVWLSVALFSFVEMIIARFILPNFTPSVNIVQTTTYVFFHLGHIGFTLVVIIDPYATVTNRSQGLAMSLLFAVAISSHMIFVCEFAVVVLKALSNALAISIGENELFSLRSFVVLVKIIQILVAILGLTFFVIVPFSLTNPEQQQVFFDIGFIVLGVFVSLNGQLLAFNAWRLRSLALAQIGFLKTLTGDHTENMEKLSFFAKRVQRLSIMALCNTSILCIVAVVIGANLESRWWCVHIIESSTVLFLSIVIAFRGSSVLFLLKSRFQPRQSQNLNSSTEKMY